MSLTTANSERRKNKRKRPPSLIYVELSSANGGMMRDLSEEGFALRAMMPLTQGYRTPFSFLLNETLRIEGEGETVWVEDKGRLAGIRFTDLSSQARKEIQNWLDEVSDAPEAKEEEESAAPVPQTFDQLREELRSPPQRGTAFKSKTMWPIPPTAPPPLDSRGQQSAPQSYANLPDLSATPPEEDLPVEATKRVGGPIPFPTPDFPMSREAVEKPFESVSDARKSIDNDLRSQPNSKRAPSPTLRPEEVIARTGPPSELPDISKILMQPSRKTTSDVTRPPVLEPLDVPGHGGGRFEERPARGFTLSRAIGMMLVIACVVAGVVYHEELGLGMIWLGQQIGGASQVKTPESLPTTQAPNPETTDATATNPTNPATQAVSSATPQSKQNQEDQNNETTQPSSNPNPPPSATPKPASPLVDPLTRTSSTSPAPSEPSQESGSLEYAKAQQLLSGKNGGSDSSEAVRLLWISVEKGNPNAELTLAELYWHGQGVARNCDQTRILLSAAARKGNADAQKRLHQFQREGCE